MSNPGSLRSPKEISNQGTWTIFWFKVLTFFHDRGSAPAILGSIAAKWINEHVPSLLGDKNVNAEIWSVQTYERYIRWTKATSEAYEIHRCSLEQVTFSDIYDSWSSLYKEFKRI